MLFEHQLTHTAAKYLTDSINDMIEKVIIWCIHLPYSEEFDSDAIIDHVRRITSKCGENSRENIKDVALFIVSKYVSSRGDTGTLGKEYLSKVLEIDKEVSNYKYDINIAPNDNLALSIIYNICRIVLYIDVIV